METKTYFANVEMSTTDVQNGFTVDFRGGLALELIEHWGMVAGVNNGEDTCGRARLDVMPVEEVVERAFAMAEQAYQALEARGWIKPVARTVEEAHRRMGELRGMMTKSEINAEWPGRKTA